MQSKAFQRQFPAFDDIFYKNVQPVVPHFVVDKDLQDKSKFFAWNLF